MPPLEEELSLDIRQALEAVRELDQQFQDVVARFKAEAEEALSDLEVTADAEAVTQELDTAVEAADTDVDIEAEADEVTSSIDEAVEAADTDVEVAGDASSVTDSIDDAVAAADTEIAIEVDEGSFAGIAESISEEFDGIDTGGIGKAIPEASEKARSALSDLANDAGTVASGIQDITPGVLAFGSSLALIAGSAALVSSVLSAQEFRATLKITEVLLRNQGEAAQFTTSEMEKLADESSIKFNIDATEVLKAQNLILRFGGISKENFERTIELSADLAAIMGTNVVGAANILGRALQEPVSGMALLRRSMGQLDDSQRTLILSLVEAGDVSAAQGVLLDALAEKIGGVAEESSKATEALSTRAKNLAKDLGKPFLFILDFFVLLGDSLVDVGKDVDEFLKIITFSDQFRALGEILFGAKEDVEELGRATEDAAGDVGKIIPPAEAAGAAVQGLGADVEGAAEKIVVALPPIVEATQDFVSSVEANFPTAGDVFEATAQRAASASENFQQEVAKGTEGVTANLVQFSQDAEINLKKVTDDLNKQVDQQRDFWVNLRTITKRGGGDIALEIAAMGPVQGAAFAQAVAEASQAELIALEAATERSKRQYQVSALQAGNVYNESIAQGMVGSRGQVLNAVGETARQATSQLLTVWGARSPSKVAMEIGGFFGEGLAIGIREATGKVELAASEVALAVPQAMQPITQHTSSFTVSPGAVVVQESVTPRQTAKKVIDELTREGTR